MRNLALWLLLTLDACLAQACQVRPVTPGPDADAQAVPESLDGGDGGPWSSGQCGRACAAMAAHGCPIAEPCEQTLSAIQAGRLRRTPDGHALTCGCIVDSGATACGLHCPGF